VREKHVHSSKVQAEDMEALLKQQSKSQACLAQDVADLKQQLVQRNNAQSSADKKIADLNVQSTPRVTRLEQEAGAITVV
jgi:hypothetical protein